MAEIDMTKPQPFAKALVHANLPELCGAEERESA